MPTSAFRRNDAEAGMALAEVLVALLIMGGLLLAFGQSLPALRRVGREALFETRLEAFVARAARDARREQRIVRITLAADALYAGGARRFDLAGAPGGVSLIAAAELARDGYPAIAFLPDGTSSGGRIRLGQGHAARALDVHWFDSRLRWQPE